MKKSEYKNILNTMSTKVIKQSLARPSSDMLKRPVYITLHKIVLRERGEM